jgi:hypothetical protein
MPDNLIRRQANSHFRTLPGTEERKSVISSSADVATAVATNTARLKGLRLARDATEQAAPRKAAPARKTGGKTKPLATSG